MHKGGKKRKLGSNPDPQDYSLFHNKQQKHSMRPAHQNIASKKKRATRAKLFQLHSAVLLQQNLEQLEGHVVCCRVPYCKSAKRVVYLQ